jgi:hypothetical protein
MRISNFSVEELIVLAIGRLFQMGMGLIGRALPPGIGNIAALQLRRELRDELRPGASVIIRVHF